MSKFNIEKLGTLHPSIRADDWRSPLVIRLLKSGPYADGADEFELDYLDKGAGCAVQRLDFCWSGLGDDYKRCQNTYQATVITEFAALGLSCLATKNVAGLEITEVTRRGDRADYWLDDDSLLEVSGQASGNLDTLLESKTEQLLANPHAKSGFVFVANFKDRESYLHFKEYQK